ncbi:MAG: NADH-quinone oxidoreductase subunit I [Deltaproteobacteria bacterium]|nr:NADH-quinone oxidoreductase subunit I [Deltaproteobacteria bacterium]MDQ3296502.1 NADH-quinone oxidoreductase subunit I [Myxococcota bacterium]
MSSSHDHADDSEHEGPLVLAVSDRHPRVRTIQVVRPEAQDTTYLAATAKGFGITLKHFAKNLFLPLKKLSGRANAGAPVEERFRNDIETVQYPEEKVTYPERFRGLHRLTLRDDGSTRCVACMCCPTVCPAHCITIIPEESGDTSIEKRPAIFEIDELRCVVCGLCVEACPCDAIRMDTGEHAKPVEDRARAIETRETMLARGVRSIATQGGEGPNWRATAPDTKTDVNR